VASSVQHPKSNIGQIPHRLSSGVGRTDIEGCLSLGYGELARRAGVGEPASGLVDAMAARVRVKPRSICSGAAVRSERSCGVLTMLSTTGRSATF